jgi:hypothetical protein
MACIFEEMDQWDEVTVIRKKATTPGVKSSSNISAAIRSGAEIETNKKCNFEDISFFLFIQKTNQSLFPEIQLQMEQAQIDKLPRARTQRSLIVKPKTFTVCFLILLWFSFLFSSLNI